MIRFLYLLSLIFFLPAFTSNASVSLDTVARPENLFSPAGTETSKSITFLWDKPGDYKSIVAYDIYKDGKKIGSTQKTNYTASNLKPDKTYSFYVVSRNSNGTISTASNFLQKKTSPKSKIFNIIKYGAVGDGATMNTKAIQKAINACTPGGTVFIPAGTYLSGALFLKSNMTLYIAKGATLKGSSNIKDYYPLIPTRFEGWEVPSFGSLITAGKLNNKGPANVKNLAIRGEGTIYGGGNDLGKAMTAAEGKRSRDRLICLMNCENVDIQGLTLLNSPCWNIHYTYCKNVVCRDLTIENSSANGDGIDPDSSTDSFIFNSSFSTGDDCIAIKSGKNPEGNVINIPTENVRITDCNFIKGHSLAIGSEISGGIRNVFIRDCKIGQLDNGIRIKTNDQRGGYVEKVVVKDCDLLKILITTAYTPNSDGEPAKELTNIKDILFENLNMSAAPVKKPVIAIDGFKDLYFKNILLKNIILPENAAISIKYCENIVLDNVLTSSKQKPQYIISDCGNIQY